LNESYDDNSIDDTEHKQQEEHDPEEENDEETNKNSPTSDKRTVKSLLEKFTEFLLGTNTANVRVFKNEDVSEAQRNAHDEAIMIEYESSKKFSFVLMFVFAFGFLHFCREDLDKISTQQHILRQRQAELGRFLGESLRSGEQRNLVVEELVKT
jgi:hypothetical protein